MTQRIEGLHIVSGRVEIEVNPGEGVAIENCHFSGDSLVIVRASSAGVVSDCQFDSDRKSEPA